MRYGLALVVSVTWALWLGGLITLFVMVSHLFSADRATAVVAAPRMFLAFERYQLALAGVALIAATFWRLREPRAVLTGLFIAFAAAAVGAILSAALITPRLDALRRAGESAGPAFRQLHGVSMITYSGNAAVLLLAGLMLVAAITHKSEVRGTSPTAPPAKIPQGDA